MVKCAQTADQHQFYLNRFRDFSEGFYCTKKTKKYQFKNCPLYKNYMIRYSKFYLQRKKYYKSGRKKEDVYAMHSL